MENYGNEIGQKMRSAVKAKLQELGTGGSAGYIDDELPDYVMIMVANKRSKQQMISDLNLFLGSQTELFVTWLHEVLQKLQEVTLPASASLSKKRKSSHKEDTTPATSSSSKKEKKQIKKEKNPVKKTKETVESPDKNVSGKASGSIRDIFAEELLEKAKHEISATTDIAQNIKKHKHKSAMEEDDSTSELPNERQEFDIPTISEISSTTGATSSKSNEKETQVISGNREKDLAELAEIQKKIYAAKKQLKQIGELDDDDYDEDFITLRDDESRETFSETVDAQKTPPTNSQRPKVKSPIVFEKTEKPKERATERDEDRRSRFTPPLAANTRANSSSREEASEKVKRPVHERLGLKSPGTVPKETSRDRRRNLQEKELYVPAFRRKEMERERTREVNRDLSRERPYRGRERERDSDRHVERSRESDGNQSRGRSRVRRSVEDRDRRRGTPEKLEMRSSSQVGKISTTTLSSSSDQNSPDVNSSRSRIGSRVIVAPSKAMEPSDEEEVTEKPVNSIIKIKPRAAVSPSKQAPKNLLLRAVAEAQKSTILKRLNTSKPKISARLGDKIVPERSTKLYTKSFRDRRKSTASVGAIFTRTAQNLIVEVNGRSKERYASNLNDNADEEYIPEIVSDRGESDPDLVYVPQSIKPRKPLNDEENWSTADSDSCYEHIDLVEGEQEHRTPDQNTQFVVTLNEENTFPKLKSRGGSRYSTSPPPQVSSSSNHPKDREKYPEPTSTSNSYSTRKTNAKPRISSKSSSHDNESSPFVGEGSTTPPRRSELIEVYRKPKEVKKIIIKNDSEDDEMSPTKKRSPDQENNRKRSSKECNEDKSNTPPLRQQSRQKESLTPSKRKHAPIKFDLENENKDSKEKDCKRESSPIPTKKRRSSSRDRDQSRDRSRERERAASHERREEKRKISIRNSEAKKYENIPSSLNSVPVDSSAYRNIKPKERCKYHPNCTKTFCEFYHPTAPCKSFPNCKYADKCMYSHPKCKYDLACVNLDCNFSHSGPRSSSLLEPAAPPLSSSVVPVQNYKSISSTAVTGPVSSTTCKFFPNCTKSACPFYHPKPCRYGKNCINKLECLFYHHEVLSSSKFKWVASN
ncbi:nuclear polyadenosine RNA-binding 2 [Musca autumnalis]|uniref:nuclear polyadenosine RNA-binding 2 n=1 Tax=Musca autumnalis TaxID=221902 RepID=UPI003CFAAC2F